MPKAQMAKWGNSLAVRIPKDVAEQACLKEGDAVEIKAAKGKIELRPAERIPTLEDLVAQITPENRYPETNWGPDVGREEVEW
jgi:antitoxin MazE